VDAVGQDVILPYAGRKRMRTVEWRGGHVAMIDQRALPHELIVVEYADYRQVAAAIRDMVVRGAPAIGVDGGDGAGAGGAAELGS